MAKPDLKICGLTRRDDVEMCLRLGVRFVGFNFCEHSKRRISPRQAADMWRDSQAKAGLRGATTLAVAVICDFDPQAVRELLAVFPEISIIQCHGQETGEQRQSLRKSLDGRQMWQAFRVRSQADVLDAVAAAPECDRILLDAASAIPNEFGGTGHAFDWSWLSAVSAPYVLAGGVNLENIHDAMSLQPDIIDICSGVEDEPGIKNHMLLQRIMDSINE